MFQLDDKFLQDLGISDLPEDQKQGLLQSIYAELEERVGVKLSQGLTDDQMEQFESFINRDEDKVTAWFAANLPGYAQAEDYQKFKASAPGGTPDIAIMSEYGSLKWLELNRPDYRDVVAAELEALKQELIANRDKILGAAA